MRFTQTHPRPPVHEIAPGVFCFGPRGRSQTNVYLVRSDQAWSLIDAGWASDADDIARAAEVTFGPRSRPASILLTHSHPDHAGAARELAERWACPVYVHPAELALAMGDYASIHAHAAPLDAWVILPALRALGRRRCERVLARTSLRDVARAFDPHARLPGLPDWTFISAAGHTPGHSAFFRKRDRVLIAGDALATVELNSPARWLAPKPGLSGPPWYSTWNWTLAQATLIELAQLDPNVLACGHGPPLIGTRTAATLRSFADRCMGSPSSAARSDQATV